MKNLITSLLATCVMVLTLSGCLDHEMVFASATKSTQEHFVDSFNGVEVGSAVQSTVIYSETDEYISIEASSNLHPYIIVDKDNGNLRIQVKNNVRIQGPYSITATIYTSNQMDQFSASGASSIKLNSNIQVNNIGISCSGASQFTGNIHCSLASVSLSGGSKADLEGDFNELNAVISGGSQLQDYGLEVNQAKFDLSGGSYGNITVNQVLDVEASGGSVLRYKGNGHTNQVQLSGGSQVLKMD